jgi:hypothetical protein
MSTDKADPKKSSKVEKQDVTKHTVFDPEIPDEELEKVAAGCGDSTMTEGKIK